MTTVQIQPSPDATEQTVQVWTDGCAVTDLEPGNLVVEHGAVMRVETVTDWTHTGRTVRQAQCSLVGRLDGATVDPWIVQWVERDGYWAVQGNDMAPATRITVGWSALLDQVAACADCGRRIGQCADMSAGCECDACETDGRHPFATALARITETATDAGTGAAGWYVQDSWGGRSSGDPTDAARAVLRGLDEGDPAVLDGLPTADLSGQWADGPTVETVASDAGLDPAALEPHELDAVYAAWCEAFDQAATDEVTRAALLQVTDETDDTVEPATYESPGARLLRDATADAPVAWSPETGWRDDTDETDDRGIGRLWAVVALLALSAASLVGLGAARSADPVEPARSTVEPAAPADRSAPCAGTVVTVDAGEQTPCDVRPPQRLDVQDMTSSGCADAGGRMVGRTCRGVDY